MVIVSRSQGCCRHFINHCVYTAWKKRPVLLASILVFTVIFVVFQYHTVTKDSEKTLESNARPRPFGLSSVDQSEGGGDGPGAGWGGHDESHSGHNGDLNRPPIPKRNLSSVSRQRSPTGLSYPFNAPSDGHPNDRLLVNGQGDTDRVQHGRGDINARQDDGGSLERGGVGNDNKFFVNQESSDRGVGPIKNVDEYQRMIKEGIDPMTGMKKKSSGVPKFRLVHLDLKGAPPKISYFKQIFPLLKAAGANGILIEYEEMFPYWGPISGIKSDYSYSKDDVKAINELAKIHSFQVIPLVQTFGHLEFVLKLPEYRHLREVDMYPMALCPSKNESFTLIKNMIDQTVMMHPGIKYLHIGCDEVYHMGYCDKCRMKDRDTIYTDHVSRVARYVRDKYNIIPIVWDDMLRNIGQDKLRQLGPLVEPMVWTYVKDVYRFIPYSTWVTFSEVFPNIWAASAFKGAFGETLIVPNAKMHLENNQAWLEVMSEQEKNFKSFQGIAITGWQRYDHLANLCETLPASMPSLILNLLTVSEGKFDNPVIVKKFNSVLQCSSPSRNYYSSGTALSNEFDFDHDPFLWSRAGSCNFPGVNFFKLTQTVEDTVKRVDEYIYDVTVHKAWMTEYNVRHNISNPHRIEEGLQEHSTIYYTLGMLFRSAEDALKEVFDPFTVYEWIEQHIYPSILKMEQLTKTGIELKRASTWPKRPLPILEDLKRFMRDRGSIDGDSGGGGGGNSNNRNNYFNGKK